MNKILIVEDDNSINNLIKEFLGRHSFECDQAYSGTEAIMLFEQVEYDLVILDLMLPGKSGEEVILHIKTKPVLVLSAKDSTDDKVNLLNLGASDFLSKPFDLAELLARVQVLLRTQQTPYQSNTLAYNEWSLDSRSYTFSVDGLPLELTKHEFLIIELFMRNPQRVFSKSDIYEYAWGESYYVDDKTINVHISNIRNKLKVSKTDRYIETVWGLGFKLK